MSDLFSTAYVTGTGTYGAYIAAADWSHARAIAIQRGLSEVVQGEIEAPALPNRLLSLIKDEEWLEAAHEATFLGFVGISSGALAPAEVLGGAGLVHELLHLARERPHHPDECPKNVRADKAERSQLIKRVSAMAMQQEWRVPGWPKSFSGYPGVTTRVIRRKARQEVEAL